MNPILVAAFKRHCRSHVESVTRGLIAARVCSLLMPIAEHWTTGAELWIVAAHLSYFSRSQLDTIHLHVCIAVCL